jgi:hypothetical protein
LVPESLQRFNARRIHGDQLREIQMNSSGVRTGSEQFRHLGDAEPTGQTHEASISLVHDADPAVHVDCETQYASHVRRKPVCGNGRF